MLVWKKCRETSRDVAFGRHRDTREVLTTKRLPETAETDTTTTMGMTVIKLTSAEARTRFLHNKILRFQLGKSQRRQLILLTHPTSTSLPSFHSSHAISQLQGSLPKPSTRLYNTNTNNSSANKPNPRPQPSNIEPPVFDFKSLGLKGPVKVVVIAVICVLGTIETIFWVKVGLRWWNGESVDVEADEEGKKG